MPRIATSALSLAALLMMPALTGCSSEEEAAPEAAEPAAEKPAEPKKDGDPAEKAVDAAAATKAGEQVGEKAPDWNICVSDLQGKWVQITDNGFHNKEPDWVPIVTPGR